MSATSSVSSQAVSEWVRLFPRQMTETYTSSVTFMKQLTAVTVSTITYLKNIFPEDSFTTQSFGGIKLRILKNKCRDDFAQFVTTALTHAFEAVDKQYLHQLALCFYDGEYNGENLVEYHIFEYTYNSEGVSMNVHSKGRDNVCHSMQYGFENIREKTIRMIKTCVLLLNTYQGPLPESYKISLRLHYNDNAPEGYQAPGFQSTQEDHLEPTVSDTWKLGSVATPFHKLVANTYIKHFMETSINAVPSQNPSMMTQNEQGDFTSPRKSWSETSEMQLRCPCNRYETDTQLLICQYCSMAQHAVCFGVSSSVAASLERHCCVTCGERDPQRTPTDPNLATLDERKRQCLCMFRRTLQWCSQVQTLSLREIMDKYDFTTVSAFKLMKLLHSHGIINKEPDTNLIKPHQIIQDQVTSVTKNYFLNKESNLVSRLVAETFFQGSQPDPVGDVLGTLEKVSLENATTLGRVTEPEHPINVEDSTLKEYKEAILLNERVDEVLPLSGAHNPIKDVEKLGRKRKIVEPGDRKTRSGMKSKKMGRVTLYN